MYQKIVAVLAGYTDYPLAQFSPQTDLITDLSLNSIDIINIIAQFETDFRITFAEDDVLACRTIGDIQKLIEQYQSKR